MKRPSLSLWCCAMLLCLSSWACTTSTHCPEHPGPRLQELDGDTFERLHRSPAWIDQHAAHPHSQSQMYLEVLSDSVVRLHYIRNGDIVVETYTVSNKDTLPEEW